MNVPDNVDLVSCEKYCLSLQRTVIFHLFKMKCDCNSLACATNQIYILINQLIKNKKFHYANSKNGEIKSLHYLKHYVKMRHSLSEASLFMTTILLEFFENVITFAIVIRIVITIVVHCFGYGKI